MRDHSVRITFGGITQSELHVAGSLNRNISLKLPNHPGVGPRGGGTQSELHVVGSLSLNISLKVPNPTEVSVPKDSPVPNPTDVSIHVAESLCPQLFQLILVPTSVNGQGWSVVPSQCARSATIVFKMLFHQFICKCHFCCFILISLF